MYIIYVYKPIYWLLYTVKQPDLFSACVILYSFQVTKKVTNTCIREQMLIIKK